MGTSTGRNKINSDTGRLSGLEALSFRTWERFPSVTHSFLFFLQRRGHIRHHTFKDGLASLLLLWTTRINRRSGAVRGAASETSSTVLLRALAHWARWQFGLADCNNNYKVRGCSFSSSLLQSCRLTLRGNFLFAMQSNIFRWNKSEGLLDGVGKGRLIWNPDGLYARLRNLLLFLHVPRIWTKSCTDRRGITTGKFQKSYEREYEKSNAPLVLLFQKKKKSDYLAMGKRTRSCPTAGGTKVETESCSHCSTTHDHDRGCHRLAHLLLHSQVYYWLWSLNGLRLHFAMGKTQTATLTESLEDANRINLIK